MRLFEGVLGGKILNVLEPINLRSFNDIKKDIRREFGQKYSRESIGSSLSALFINDLIEKYDSTSFSPEKKREIIKRYKSRHGVSSFPTFSSLYFQDFRLTDKGSNIKHSNSGILSGKGLELALARA